MTNNTLKDLVSVRLRVHNNDSYEEIDIFISASHWKFLCDRNIGMEDIQSVEDDGELGAPINLLELVQIEVADDSPFIFDKDDNLIENPNL